MSVQIKQAKLAQLTHTSFCNYLPAVVKHNSSKHLGWHIEFYAMSPKTHQLARYRYKLNSVRKRYRLLSEFYAQASVLVGEINARLASGWLPETAAATSQVENPIVVPTPAYSSWVEETKLSPVVTEQEIVQDSVAQLMSYAEPTPAILSAPIQTTQQNIELPITPCIKDGRDERDITLVELIDLCIEAKKDVVRKDTLRSYNGFAKDMKDFVNTYYPNILAKNFTREHAREYITRKTESMRERIKKLDKKYDVSQSSINNQIKGMRAFFAWGIENNLVEDNPFQKLKLHIVDEKRRTLVDEESLTKIKKHLNKKNQKGFLLVCMLVHGGFIRPKEIRQLKVENVSFKDHCIIVPAHISKNHCKRIVGVTPEIENLLLDMQIGLYPGSYYLVGSKMQPNRDMASERQYRTAWSVMRDELGLPEEMQLYSLKDTGITTMLENGVAPIDVMKQAGHHDLSMTTRYANHTDKRLAKKMYANALTFGENADEETE